MGRVYVEHPVTPELKAELIASGARIVDARFAPPGADIYKAKPDVEAAPEGEPEAKPKPKAKRKRKAAPEKAAD